MSDNMKKFLELVSGDENLKQKTLALNDMEPKDAISAGIALAKELGIELSEADFTKEKSGGELSDDELDAVAGGSGCGCAGPGSGGGIDNTDGNTYSCSCAFHGQGGDGRADDFNCYCPGFGGGDDWGLIPD